MLLATNQIGTGLTCRLTHQHEGSCAPKTRTRAGSGKELCHWQVAVVRQIEQALEGLERQYQQLEKSSLQTVGDTLLRLDGALEGLEGVSLSEKLDDAFQIVDEKIAALGNAVSHGQVFALLQYLEGRYHFISRTAEFRNHADQTIRSIIDGAVKNTSGAIDSTVYATTDIAYAAYHGAQRLLHFDELPAQWQSNEHIKTGYRFLDSYTRCLWSIFQLHNETGNIWTHLFGLVYFATLGLYVVFYELSTSASFFDKLMFFLFFTAAGKCLLCSTLYHTFTCHCRIPVMQCAASLDYTGISLLITASVSMFEYYAFYCHDTPRRFFMALTILLGLAGLFPPWIGFFDTREGKPYRIAMYVMMGASAALPLGYLASTQGIALTIQFVVPVCYSVATYLTGVYFYANLYPERLFPGTFDHFGNSHQLWHLFVLGGIYFHYLACLHFYANRYMFGGCSF